MWYPKEREQNLENNLKLRYFLKKDLVTLNKIGETLKNGPHLEKWVTVRKIGHTLQNGSLFEKCVTLKKWVTLRKME